MFVALSAPLRLGAGFVTTLQRLSRRHGALADEGDIRAGSCKLKVHWPVNPRAEVRVPDAFSAIPYLFLIGRATLIYMQYSNTQL